MDVIKVAADLKIYLEDVDPDVRFNTAWRYIHDLPFVSNPPSIDSIRVICTFALGFNEEQVEELVELYTTNLEK